jgi:PAS domain S-box-containing protein
VAFVTLPDTGWRVVAGVPEAQAMAGYRARRDQGLALVLAIVLLVLASAWRIASAIANPIRALAETSRKVAEGDTSVRAFLAGPAEVEAVAHHFNRMLDARTQVDLALRESESRWKFALESAGDGIWDWNILTGEVFFSPQYKAMLGYCDDEMGSTDEEWTARVHPEDLAGARADMQRHFDGQSAAYATEYRMRCKDGTFKWILARGLVIGRDAMGKPRRMVGTNSDISERKLLESDLRIGAIAFESQQAMFILDAQRKIIRVNRAFFELLGYSVEEVLGETPDILFPVDQLGASACHAVWDRIDLDGESSDEITVRCKTGERIAVWATLTIVKNDTAKITHYVGTLTDITDRKRLQVQRAEEELAQRNVLVREVHHRVKNSLQGVVGILREFGRNHPETMEPISQAVGQVQSIAVIHGLHGRSTLDQVRLCELTAEVAAGIDSLWHTSINVAIPAQWVPCLITAAEAVPVALVLNELILNAVKHGDPAYGGVQVTLQKGDLPCIVRICIMNGGMWKSATGGTHVGLQLVDSLMPRDGAKLIRVLHSDSTCTTLELGPPVISLEIIESI